MMKGLTLAGTALVGMMFLTPAAADADLAYNYVGAGYSSWDLDLGSDVETLDPDGINLSGSFLITDQIFLSLDFYLVEDSVDIEDAFGSVRFEEETMLTDLRLGFRMPISDRGDFVASLGYLRSDSDFELRGEDAMGGEVDISDSVDSSGFSLGFGLRQLITPELELSVMFDHWDLDETDTGLVFGANYDFTRNLGVGGSYRLGDDINILNVGLRYRF